VVARALVVEATTAVAMLFGGAGWVATDRAGLHALPAPRRPWWAWFWSGLLILRLRRRDAPGADESHRRNGVPLLWLAANLELAQPAHPARRFAEYIAAHATAGDAPPLPRHPA